ncbi:MAG: PKD domain-containing protein, partial [Bacteroidales bacterium]|nr:PKD domain-containing protein [Bacteroidales bacterium]
VYITDAKGCATSYTVTITQPSPMNVYYTSSNALCHQGAQGAIQVMATGGTAPYSYQWSPIISNSSIVTGLTAGTYFVTVTDSLGCYLTQSITIQSPTPISPVILQKNDVSCFGGADGFILLGANGGTAPYSYVWNTGQTTSYLSNLQGGVYSCTVSDIFSCSATIQVSINTPSEPLQISISVNGTNCNQSFDGTAQVSVIGGTPPYTYFWVPGGYTTSSVSNLSAGTYTVSVFDANQCMQSQNFTIASPPILQGVVQTYQHVQCYGEPSGIIGVNVVGGTPPYTYTWNTVPQQNTQIANNVYAGNYTVTVIDSKGCSWVGMGIINQPNELQTFIQTKDVTCYNGNNGQATVMVTGGVPAYSYHWSTIPTTNNFIAQNLSAGIYYVTVYDQNGCFKIDSCKIQQPSQIMAILPDSFVICKGETVQISASAIGGAGGYLFFWNNNQLGSSITVSPQSSFSYIVFAFDSLGCSGVPDTCRVIVKEFYPSSVHLNGNSPICPGQSTTIQVSAICNPFDTLYYQWSHSLGPGPGPFIVVPQQPTTYYVTVSNTCGISVVDSVSILFKPPPTIYFHASDFQGCVPLTIQFTDSSFTAYDAIYKWRWNFGDGTFSTVQNPIHTFQTPDTFYVSLEVETTQGCINNNHQSPFPVYVYENPKASFHTNKDVYFLPNDPVIITNTSQGAVAYFWDFGDQTISYQENPIHYYSDFNNYTITLIVTNMYQCTDTAVKVIKVSGDLLFPNAFTPNQNGSNGGYYSMNDYSNQVFFPVSKGVSEFHMQIFNRWGELIFETKDISIGWDGYYKGQLCPQDVYVYQAKATFIDGRKIEKKGDVLLIR